MYKKGEFIYGYEIIEPLGSGAICQTYKAVGPNGKFVTMKFPSLAMVGDASTYERFLRESKIGKQLVHPAIPRTIALFRKLRSPLSDTGIHRRANLALYFSRPCPIFFGRSFLDYPPACIRFDIPAQPWGLSPGFETGECAFRLNWQGAYYRFWNSASGRSAPRYMEKSFGCTGNSRLYFTGTNPGKTRRCPFRSLFTWA